MPWQRTCPRYRPTRTIWTSWHRQSAESQALGQLTTDANDGEAVCYSTQAATLSSNADALNGAAQTVTNDVTQLNGAETTSRTLEQSEPLKAPVDASSFATV